uniref:Uncharacterized protein n=1 Tax=Ditylenchus dipsaci TaxID=166011 RepID=A0A915DS70_9BILA
MHSNSETFFRLHSVTDGECHKHPAINVTSGTSTLPALWTPNHITGRMSARKPCHLHRFSPINIEGDLLMVDQIKGRITTANDVLPSQQVEEVAQQYGFNESVKEAIAKPPQKPGPYGTDAFGSMPSVPQMIWNWLPSFKDVWMWTCCLVVTLKVFTDYVWPRLLRMGLRKLGIQISEQVSRKGRKRAVKKLRLSDLRQRSNEEEEEDEARPQNSPWPPIVSLGGMSRTIAIQ